MALKKFNFNVLKKEKFARLGKITTSRGTIDTPVFMPVGTQATVKGIFFYRFLFLGSLPDLDFFRFFSIFLDLSRFVSICLDLF